eukprot:gene5212-15408_t
MPGMLAEAKRAHVKAKKNRSRAQIRAEVLNNQLLFVEKMSTKVAEEQKILAKRVQRISTMDDKIACNEDREHARLDALARE